MILRMLVFAEYADTGQENKLVVAGVVDTVSVARRPDVPADAVGHVALPSLYLVASIEGSLSDGLSHKLGLRVLNDDGNVVVSHPELAPVQFQVNAQGRPMRFNAVIRLAGMAVPSPGDYVFELLMNGDRLGDTPLYVNDTTASG